MRATQNHYGTHARSTELLYFVNILRASKHNQPHTRPTWCILHMCVQCMYICSVNHQWWWVSFPGMIYGLDKNINKLKRIFGVLDDAVYIDEDI